MNIGVCLCACGWLIGLVDWFFLTEIKHHFHGLLGNSLVSASLLGDHDFDFGSPRISFLCSIMASSHNMVFFPLLLVLFFFLLLLLLVVVVVIEKEHVDIAAHSPRGIDRWSRVRGIEEISIQDNECAFFFKVKDL